MQLIAFVTCWAAYLIAVGVGLMVCTAMAIAPAVRTSAKRFASGLIGSVPGVAIFQLAALPVVAVIVGLLWALQRALGDLTGVAAIVWGVVVVVGTIGVFALASLCGFVSGWATGVRVIGGIPIGTALRESLAFRLWLRMRK
jgi:hypothetical protein